MILLLPALTTAGLGLGWLVGLRISERTIARLTGGCYSLTTGLVIILGGWMASNRLDTVRLLIGSWFEVHTYRFPLLLQIDRLSLPLVALSVILVGVIGAFSQSVYMHREGVLRLDSSSAQPVRLPGCCCCSWRDLSISMIAGWELVGLTSVLLIGFFSSATSRSRVPCGSFWSTVFATLVF
jgi:NAD(P)H-quinone oxidoreductase subunit 5